jgi:hypothetical protein
VGWNAKVVDALSYMHLTRGGCWMHGGGALGGNISKLWNILEHSLSDCSHSGIEQGGGQCVSGT